MTTAVVSVRRDMGFKDIVQNLTEHDITAVPVIDDQGRPIGVVSEADLLRRQEGQADPGGHLSATHLLPTESAKAHALTAGELMTSPAVTARPQWSVVEAARAMARHHVKRLPVVDDLGLLVGIVSRDELLHVFLRRDIAIQEVDHHAGPAGPPPAARVPPARLHQAAPPRIKWLHIAQPPASATLRHHKSANR